MKSIRSICAVIATAALSTVAHANLSDSEATKLMTKPDADLNELLGWVLNLK